MRSQNRLAPISFTLALLISQMALMPLALAIPNPTNNGRGQKESLPAPPATPIPDNGPRVPAGTLKQEPLPEQPTTPPPDGNRQPGGALSEELAICPAKSQNLTAVTPVNVQGKTLSGHPTFWFYMPYTADEVKLGEFSILNQAEDEHIYKTSFDLPNQPGFVSITLPADEARELEVGQYYHWYLTLSCVSSDGTESNLEIDGWVERVASAPQDYPSPEIWYDMVDGVAKQLQTVTASDDLRETWTELLKSVELCELTEAPVVGPVMLTNG